MLHTFQGPPSDGTASATPTFGPDGALYGASAGGGTFDRGTIYRLVQTGSGWSETVLYSFCQVAQFACFDGAYPQGGLAIDENGTIFGTTIEGGEGIEAGWGAVFRLDPPVGGGSWTYRVIYNFCSQDNCADGQVPTGNLVLTHRGKLYGTVQGIGIDGMGGAIYSVDTDGSHYRVLHPFPFRTGTDGYIPRNGLARDSHGVLYGTTQFDNSSTDCGTVYSFDPSSSAFQTLHRFCSRPNDVDAPFNVPTIVENGNGITIYGIAEGGQYGRGGLYRLHSPATSGGRWSERVVHAFCADPGCPDGAFDSSDGTVTLHQGAIYGALSEGGATNGGVLFRWSGQP